MNLYKKKIAAFLVLACMLCIGIGAPALAQESDSDSDISVVSIVGDFFILRPLGIATQILGASLFVITYPVSATMGNTDAVGKKLIDDPAKFTWGRPLGQMP